MVSTIGPIAKSCRSDLVGQGLDQLGAGRAGLADEIAVELARQEGRGLGAIEHDPDDVGRSPRPGLAEEGLGPVVDLRLVVDEPRRLLEAAARILADPAGERPGGLADVVLREMAGAQGEQLEELAGEVLVGLVLLAGAPVEPDEHGRVGDDRFQERGESAEGVGSQRLVLLVHQRDRLHLLVAGGEMPVPEEGELLAERVGPVEDAVEPADLEQVEVRRGPRRLAQAVDGLEHPRWGAGAGGTAARRWPRDRPRRRGGVPLASRRSRRGDAGGPPCGGPTGRPASARSEPRGNRLWTSACRVSACRETCGRASEALTASEPHPAAAGRGVFGHVQVVGRPRSPLPALGPSALSRGEGFSLRTSHRACGFSIRISPRSRVSPGLTVKSLRIWSAHLGLGVESR